MRVVLGVDIGSSATKIVAMDENKHIISSMRVSAADQVTALFGSIGRLLYENSIQLENVAAVMLTGMGASFAKGDIYGLQTRRVTEFEALGTGGLFLSGLSAAVVGSVGTGTALVEAADGQFRHVGGSAVGGGTLVGLSSRLFGIDRVDVIAQMAEKGNLKNVDWSISELSSADMPTLPDYATSSNLGKMKSTATDNDVALGLFNMIFQTVGTLAVFACRNTNLTDVVVTGSLATLDLAKIMLGQVGELYSIHFVIPENAAFATAIGAALLYFE